jgi:RND family efflux transporter MFP subunit
VRAFALLLAALSGGGAAAALVSVQSLEQLAVYPEHRAPATVLSLNESRLSAELNARVTEIPVRVGDVVEPGAVLLRLDCRDYTLAETQAAEALAGLEARLRLARQQLQRAQTLKQQRSVAEELLDQRRAELDQLSAERRVQDARLASARLAVGKCTVTAPFRALVLERLSSVGELAAPGAALLRVLDLAHLEVSAQVLTDDAEGIQQAHSLRLALRGRDYPLRLRTLLPAVNTVSRSREARLSFAAEGALPGSAGELVWQAPGPHVPAELVVRRDGVLGLFLVENGVARFHPLPGAEVGRPAPVALPAGTRVVTEGRFNLEDGEALEGID